MRKSICCLSITLLLILLFKTSCKQSSSEGPATTPSKKTVQTAKQNSLLPTAIVSVDYLRLRDAPKLNATEIATLRASEQVALTGEITAFRQNIRLRGLLYNDPWVHVQTSEGDEGWVYGGGLSFRAQPQSVVASTILEGRLRHFLGDSLATQLQAYAENYINTPCNEFLFAERLHKALQLRPEIENQLNKYFTYSNSLPDFYWIEKFFPPFFVFVEEEQGKLQLFMDFKQLQVQARACEGKNDDKLVQLYFELFSLDSLEQKYPSYLLRDREKNTTYMLIAEGKAKRFLQLLSELYLVSNFYDKIVSYWKNRWLNDLLGGQYPFWEERDEVLSEIKAILELNLPILTEEDRQRLKQLK